MGGGLTEELSGLVSGNMDMDEGVSFAQNILHRKSVSLLSVEK